TIFVVVSATSAERVAGATTALTQELSKNQDLFQSVNEPGSNPFFIHNGLLYQPTDALRQKYRGAHAGPASRQGSGG
ncbi:MAG: hypothetical protein WA858_11785, partial [Xanthobacteraceae bacterium]